MEANKDQDLREKNFQELMKEIQELNIEENEEIDVFSLSDIPEIPSALERNTSRPSTPFPTDTLNNTESFTSKPWKITSGTPRLTFESSESLENFVLPTEDLNESWIRVDITENSTLKVNAGHGGVSYPRNPTPRPPLEKPPSNQFVYLSIDELMNQDRKESKKVVGALKNQDTGSLHPLQLLEEDKHEQKRIDQNVSWCSVYLLLKVFGLVLLTSGIAAMVVVSLPKTTEVITIITKSKNTSASDTNEVEIIIENIFFKPKY